MVECVVFLSLLWINILKLDGQFSDTSSYAMSISFSLLELL